MRDREVPPQLPELEANMPAADEVTINVLHRRNNWMQGWEGEMDTIHAAFLHGGATMPEDTQPGSLQFYEVSNRAGKFDHKPQAGVFGFLAARQLLLVLDNCEPERL